MSSVAAGAYLKYMRERRKLRQEDIAAYLKKVIGTDTTNKQIYRWETGETMPAADALAAFTICVDGNPAHVMSLLLDASASGSDGIELARQDYQQHVIADMAQTIPPEQLSEISRLLARLADIMPGINDLLKERD